MNSDPFSPGPQLPGSSLACSVSIHTEHLRGWRRLILLLGQMPPDSRLHDSQHLSRRAAEGPRPPCVLCSTHLAHSVPPRSQPPATRPHQGHLQPLYQADLKTHSQVKKKTKGLHQGTLCCFSQCCSNIDMVIQIEFVQVFEVNFHSMNVSKPFHSASWNNSRIWTPHYPNMDL